MASEMRLIDANALVKQLQKSHEYHARNCREEVLLYRDIRIINERPTVDAVEVVHGHWCWEGKFKACSRCGSYVEWDETLGANFWKFCPCCGAKMDGGTDNGL